MVALTEPSSRFYGSEGECDLKFFYLIPDRYFDFHASASVLFMRPHRDVLGDVGCPSGEVEAVECGYRKTRRSKKAD